MSQEMNDEFFLEDVDEDIDVDLTLESPDVDLTLDSADEYPAFGEGNPQFEASKKWLERVGETYNLNNATSRATKNSMKVFFMTLMAENINIDFDTCSKEEMADAVHNFFLHVRKSDGELYKKTAFGSLKWGLVRGMRVLRSDVDFSVDPEFRRAMKTFKSQLKMLERVGKTVNHADRISKADLEKLYSSDVFNIDKPTTLQYKVFFEIIFYLFSARGKQNLRRLKPSHIVIKRNEKGRKYVQIVDKYYREPTNDSRHDNELGTSASESMEINTESHLTRRGGHIYEIPGSPKCPVAAIEKYLSKLPNDIDFLFAQPADRYRYYPDVSDFRLWYNSLPIGKNSLWMMMKDISKHAQLSKMYSNFCIHATSVSYLDFKGYNVKQSKDSSGMMGSARSMTPELLEKISDELSELIMPDQLDSNRLIGAPANDNPIQQSNTIDLTHLSSSATPTQQTSQTLTMAFPGNLQQTLPTRVIIQPIRPQAQFLTSNTVCIQPFPSYTPIRKEIPIAPKDTAGQFQASTSVGRVGTIVMPQMFIKQENQVSDIVSLSSRSEPTISRVIPNVQSARSSLSSAHVQLVQTDTSINQDGNTDAVLPSSSNNEDGITSRTGQQATSALLQNLKEKDDAIQSSRKRVSDLEQYEREYKRMLQESAILHQHLATCQTEVKDLKEKMEELKNQRQIREQFQHSISFEQICCNKPLLKHYTGYTPEEFQMLFQFLVPDLNSVFFKGRGNKLSARSQLLMTLCKLKNNFSFIDLAERFQVSKIVIKNIFRAWISHMSEKFEDVYVWPHRYTLKAQVPRHFQQDFPKTLILLKRIKVKVGSASSKPNENLLGNTCHGIVAVDSRGCVIGCSGLVRGTPNDPELFVRSGLKLQMSQLLYSGKLQKGDGILSENLDIASDVKDMGLQFNDVAFSKCDIDDQLKAILEKQRIDTHKILIDKAICRILKFKILTRNIPTSLSSSRDKIFQVSSFLTNFLPPLSLDVNDKY